MTRYAMFIMLAAIVTLSSAQYDWDSIKFGSDPDAKETDASENATKTADPKQNEVHDNAVAELSDRFLLQDNNYGNVAGGQYAQPGIGALVPTIRHLLGPRLGLLELARVFLQLVGEIRAKLQDALFAYRFLLRDSIDFLVTKLANARAFVVNGVAILRRVLQFAVELFSHWSLESQQQQAGHFVGRPLSPAPVNYPQNYGNNWGTSPVL